MEFVDVMYRVSRNDPADVYGIFPGMGGTRDLSTCTVYQRIGQHCTGDLRGMMSSSRPAEPAEYAALHRELSRLGYSLRIVKRSTKKHAQAREGVSDGSH